MIPPAAYVIVGFGVIFVMSVVLHEVAHGFVAYRCGDPTAYLMGRLTLNPVKHIDPIFTLLMPALFLWLRLPVLGGAKPVPVNPYYFRRPVRDDVLVSAAGVAVNLSIALVLAAVLHLLLWVRLVTWDSPHTIVLGMGTIANLALFLFNLIPIPPLDGSHLLRAILPWSVREDFTRMGRFGLIIIYGLIMLGLGHLLFVVMRILWALLLDASRFDHVLISFTKLLPGS
jgi:Zn-dependent protease